MLSLALASITLVVQPGLLPSTHAGVRLSPLRAGLFDVFKESVNHHARHAVPKRESHAHAQTTAGKA